VLLVICIRLRGDEVKLGHVLRLWNLGFALGAALYTLISRSAVSIGFTIGCLFMAIMAWFIIKFHKDSNDEITVKVR
jgi:hypothetical protein